MHDTLSTVCGSEAHPTFPYRPRPKTGRRSRQANRFQRKPQPTSTRSRHCSVTSRLNARHFASNAWFLGGKLHCLLTVPTRDD
jgi:hypothetical protein